MNSFDSKKADRAERKVDHLDLFRSFRPKHCILLNTKLFLSPYQPQYPFSQYKNLYNIPLTSAEYIADDFDQVIELG